MDKNYHIIIGYTLGFRDVGFRAECFYDVVAVQGKSLRFGSGPGLLDHPTRCGWPEWMEVSCPDLGPPGLYPCGASQWVGAFL